MKKSRKIFTVLLLIIGVIWFLQGINILPGSFMTGQIEWAVAGIISFGVGLLLWRSSPSSGPSMEE